jgi:tetratricopeptide (TPR) repeat protein
MCAEALRVFEQVGNRKALIRALQLSANLIDDPDEKLARSERARNLANEIDPSGDTAKLATVYTAVIRLERGELDEANHLLDGVLKSESKLAPASLAWIFSTARQIKQPAGRLAEAQTLLDKCFTMNPGGTVERAACSLEGAELLSAEGKLDDAAALVSTARATFEKSGGQLWLGAIDLHEAELARLRGHVAESEASARKAMVVLEGSDDAIPIRYAHELVARALLDQNRVREARAEIDRAASIAPMRKSFPYQVRFEIAQAHTEAAEGRTKAARRRLALTLADCVRRKFVEQHFEVRLAIAQVALHESSKEGRVRGAAMAQSLAKDAGHRGFGLIAQQARALVGSIRRQKVGRN